MEFHDEARTSKYEVVLRREAAWDRGGFNHELIPCKSQRLFPDTESPEKPRKGRRTSEKRAWRPGSLGWCP